MSDKIKHIYQFKSFRLNVGERQLLNNGMAVSLTPKVFDVLVALVERSGHLVKKEELLGTVWADTFVEEQNIARIIHELRKALGEDKIDNKYIETVAQKGYRFVVEVEEFREPLEKMRAGGNNDSTDPARRRRPAGFRFRASRSKKPVCRPQSIRKRGRGLLFSPAVWPAAFFCFCF